MQLDISKANPSKCVIHVVDDSQSIVSSLSSVLGEEGYIVTSSMNGEDAIQEIDSTKPTLVILDIEMPVMDGYETIKRLKDNKETASIPVIFLTASNKPEVIKKLFKIGASDYILKPFIPEELLARVEKEISNVTLQNKLKEKMSKLAELVTIDPITRTSNRMHMTSIINAKLKILSNDNNGSFSLMYIDIDSFSSFAKEHGISETEGTLRKFSMLLQKCIRKKDILSHWGSDVFVIMLPQIINEDLNNIAKTIKTSLEKVSFSAKSKLTCTISMLEISESDKINNIFKTLTTRLQTAKKLNNESIVMTNGRLLL